MLAQPLCPPLFPASLPACPQIHSTIYKASGGPTSYSLERAFLFPDQKSALLFLGCWLFLAARMPFLAPAPERGPTHPVVLMQSPFTLLARIRLSLWATVCLWMQTIKTWSLKIVLKPHELLWCLLTKWLFSSSSSGWTSWRDRSPQSKYDQAGKLTSTLFSDFGSLTLGHLWGL